MKVDPKKEEPKPEPTPAEIDALLLPQFTEAIRAGLNALKLSGIKDDDLDVNEVFHSFLFLLYPPTGSPRSGR